MNFIINIVITLLALAGFILAYYIRSTKKAPETLVCPLDGSCEEVITSKFSKILGVPVEVGGMLYYAIAFVAYALFAFTPDLLPSSSSSVMFAVACGAFLFSVYLTCVQAFMLKHWCTWCLCSAGISTLIFILAFYVARVEVYTLFNALLHSI